MYGSDLENKTAPHDPKFNLVHFILLLIVLIQSNIRNTIII